MSFPAGVVRPVRKLMELMELMREYIMANQRVTPPGLCLLERWWMEDINTDAVAVLSPARSS